VSHIAIDDGRECRIDSCTLYANRARNGCRGIFN
jgi:hypothetical protein